ncbi:MAG: thioredoxin [Rhodospirillales bacterium]|nr:thioredoxin [Alphaproteobacteria bacterium]MBL6929488.1 thioredoxin [Rhodospirillales bacterium]
MATTNLTRDTFENTVLENDIVLIDFWAGWCQPCKSFAPIYEKVSDGHPDVLFGKVDTDAEQELAAQFGIQSIPTLAVFRENVLLMNQPGMVPESALSELVDRVKDLDMDAVRAEIAAAQAADSDDKKAANDT